jgi:Protein of unknown function (DUF2950)
VNSKEGEGNMVMLYSAEMKRPRRRARSGFPGLIFGLLAVSAGAALGDQPRFPTPEAALEAFRVAAAAADGPALLALLGPEHEAEIVGADPAARRLELERLRRAVQEGAVLATEDEGWVTIVVGREAWPMPVPLVEEPGGWRFDTEAGLEEITDRRIGRNELAVIDTCRAYVEAQLAYAAADRDGDRVLEYAQRLASTPGRQDGLYWTADDDGEASPLGPFLAEAAELVAERRAREPFYGYYFKILTRQGPNPPGGAYDYGINGNMIAGFALLAWPADYGNSGVMTFTVSHQGEVFEKDLGEETAKLLSTIDTYDPDSTWTPVGEE